MGCQSAERRALLDLLTLLVGSSAAVQAQGILTDSDPNPGLFGPASITWEVLREPLLLLSGGRALLMQVAHPLVAQGVLDHSRFEQEPFGRLLGTVRWVMQIAFGTSTEAQAACARLARVHAPVRGSLAPENATAALAAGTRYNALDPVLGVWVHATLVDSMLVGYQALVGPLARAKQDQFVREWNRVGEALALPADRLWQTAADLRAYVRHQTNALVVTPVEGSRRAAATVLRPPFPWPVLSPASPALAFMTAGFLPAPLRCGYGLAWSRRDERVFQNACALLRRLHHVLPRRFKVAPLYDLAAGRTRAAHA